MTGERLVEVAGTYLPNAGARLMLAAAKLALDSRLPGTSIAIASQFGPFERRLETGARQVLRTSGRGRGTRLAAAIDRAMSGRGSRELHKYGIYFEQEVDALLDVSGFAISDHWGPARATDRAQRASRYRRRGRPVIFLPQSIGPLRQPDVRAAFRAAVRNADRFFVRDAQSLRTAMSAAPEWSRRVRLMPDLTIAVPVPEAPSQSDGECVVVPNGRLVDRAKGGHTRGEYIGLLTSLADAALDRSMRVRVVLHTDEPLDKALGHELAARVGVEEVETALDPLAFKQQMGPGTLVVASRFHALLAALTRGACCIAVGWSDKYPEVMSEYGLERFVIRPDDPVAPADLLDELLQRRSTGQQHELAAATVARAQQLLSEMWDEVAQLLAEASPG